MENTHYRLLKGTKSNIHCAYLHNGFIGQVAGHTAVPSYAEQVWVEHTVTKVELAGFAATDVRFLGNDNSLRVLMVGNVLDAVEADNVAYAACRLFNERFYPSIRAWDVTVYSKNAVYRSLTTLD